MKNLFLTSTAMVLLLVSCKKSTDGNKNVISQENETQVNTDDGRSDSILTTSLNRSINGSSTESKSFTYKGLDGTRSKVTFNNSEKSQTITIQANNNKFELDKKSSGLYERNGIKAVAKGDSVIITQGTNTIPLVLDK